MAENEIEAMAAGTVDEGFPAPDDAPVEPTEEVAPEGDEVQPVEGDETGEPAELSEEEKLAKLAEENPEVGKIVDELLATKEAEAAKAAAAEELARKTAEAGAVDEKDASEASQFQFETAKDQVASMEGSASAEYNRLYDNYAAIGQSIEQTVNQLVTHQSMDERDARAMPAVRQLEAQRAEVQQQALVKWAQLGEIRNGLSRLTALERKAELVPEFKKFKAEYAQLYIEGKIRDDMPLATQKAEFRKHLEAKGIGVPAPGKQAPVLADRLERLRKMRGLSPGKQAGGGRAVAGTAGKTRGDAVVSAALSDEAWGIRRK